MKKKKCKKCVLCCNFFKNSELSEEHYPARSVGNDDIVAFDIIKMMDSMRFGEIQRYAMKPENLGKSMKEISKTYFDNEPSHSIYPNGRTARTLCRKCNTFLGKYDESYKLFFDNNGENSVIKGYQMLTKLRIIKAIYAKFLSVPECKGWKFDFIDFLKNEKQVVYDGKWTVYCLKRDYGTDMMGLRNIETGKLTWDEGVMFEFSDEKFIFHLMNFEPHKEYKSMNIMDILNKQYKLISGHDVEGGYHGLLMIQNIFEKIKI